jgi:hypothetical protein
MFTEQERAMSFQITTAFIQDYKNTVALLLQQKGSRLRATVTEDSYTGKAGKAVEQVGPVKAQKRTTRHGDTPLISTPHDARWVFPTDFEWADLIDNQDKLRMIVDPTSAYAINGAMAMGRAQDDVILGAFFATAKTGEDGTTNTAFPSSQQVAANVGATGNTGLNIAKLRAAKKKMIAAQVDIDMEPMFVAVTSEQHDNLLNEAQAISLDYNTRPVLVEGRISSFMGFNFIPIEFSDASVFDAAATLYASSTYHVPCWAKSGMHLGIWEDMVTKVSERDDKSYSVQVYLRETIGATRLEEKKVVDILCV